MMLRRTVALAAVLGTAGATFGQTDPGVGGGFETVGMLYSGSGPLHDPPFPAGDGWAQGATESGVLDADGNATFDPLTGERFRSVYLVDSNWGNGGSGTDDSVFAGSNKNNDRIDTSSSGWEWETGGGGPKKNDLTNGYLHTRVDPLTGDRWVYVAAETRSTNGDSHVDFEFNQAGVEKSGSSGGFLTGMGTHRGRSINDFLISIDFTSGGENPVATVRFWDGNSFEPASAPGAIFSATNFVDIPHGSGGSWKHFAGDGSTVEVVERLQFVEAAVNLTALGIDVDPCSTNATFMIKTRSSTSFTADLKDFILVRFPLEPTPLPVLDAPGSVCPGDTFDVTVEDLNALPGAIYDWQIIGPASILGGADGATITVGADELACDDVITVIAGVAAGNCLDTVSTVERDVVVFDVDAPELAGVPADTVVECDSVPGPADVTAEDACSVATVELDETIEPGSCAGEWTIVRTWTAEDACGNVASQTQNVFVEDTTAPTITPGTDRQVFVCDAPATLDVRTSDNCGDPVLSVDFSADDPALVTLEQMEAGRYRFTFTGPVTVTVIASALDDCGNRGDAAFTVEAVCGGEACSPGYWRNNLENWCGTGFNPLPDYCFTGPATTFLEAFMITDTTAAPSSFDPAMTLLEAVDRSGGDFHQMLFQGSAALLNALSPIVDDFPGTAGEIRLTMQRALRGEISYDEATAFFNIYNDAEDECGCPTEPPPATPLTECDVNPSADLNGDGIVDVLDYLALLAAWGTPDADLDGDGTTDVQDMLALLAAWGTAG